MILHGNQRGGAKDLALHLLKTENEHVDVHELRGFVSDNLVSALNEVHAVSRGTKARQFLFSLSLNPLPSENVATAVFEDAIERIERKLGLTDQPRAIVFHEKEGRRHCHAVWSRIDAAAMKAIPLFFSKRKLMDISRELYLEQSWTMPPNRPLHHYRRRAESHQERCFTDTMSVIYRTSQTGEIQTSCFVLDKWQQAKRIGKNPRDIKRIFQDCWAVSDNQPAFQQALKECGYTLAKGDRRGFVALDHRCEVFAVAKWVGMHTREIKAKLTDLSSLPSVDEARAQIAEDMTTRLKAVQSHQDSAIKVRLSEIEQTRLNMVRRHAKARAALRISQQERWQAETKARQERFNRGLRGWLDRLTGHHRHIKKQNEEEMYEALKRDHQEQDDLIFRQLDQRRNLQARIERLRKLAEQRNQSIFDDIYQYQEIRDKQRDVATFNQHMQKRRSISGPRRER